MSIVISETILDKLSIKTNWYKIDYLVTYLIYYPEIPEQHKST
jgi:hypothetical protein